MSLTKFHTRVGKDLVDNTVTELVNGAITIKDGGITGSKLGADVVETLGVMDFNSINELKAFDVTTIGVNTSTNVLGYYSEGDGGGGTFFWDAASTDADNGGTVIAATGVTTGRWKRVYDKGILNVKWFGAKGDNSTDDTVVIQGIADMFRQSAAVAKQGQKIFFPEGVYRVTTLDLSHLHNVTLEGVCSQHVYDTTTHQIGFGSVLRSYGTSVGPILDFDPTEAADTGARYNTVRNLTIDGNNVADYGVRLDSMQTLIDSCFTKCNVAGVVLSDSTNSTTIQRCGMVRNNGHGLWSKTLANTGGYTTVFYIDDCLFRQNFGYGALFNSGAGTVTIEKTVVEGNWAGGFKIEKLANTNGASTFTFRDLYFEYNGRLATDHADYDGNYALNLFAESDVVFTGPEMHNCVFTGYPGNDYTANPHLFRTIGADSTRNAYIDLGCRFHPNATFDIGVGGYGAFRNATTCRDWIVHNYNATLLEQMKDALFGQLIKQVRGNTANLYSAGNAVEKGWFYGGSGGSTYTITGFVPISDLVDGAQTKYLTFPDFNGSSRNTYPVWIEGSIVGLGGDYMGLNSSGKMTITLQYAGSSEGTKTPFTDPDTSVDNSYELDLDTTISGRLGPYRFPWDKYKVGYNYLSTGNQFYDAKSYVSVKIVTDANFVKGIEYDHRKGLFIQLMMRG